MTTLYSEMISRSDPSQVAGLSRFFKCGPGQYGEGDRFLGIKVPVTRSVVKQVWRQTGFDEIERCICSEYHEIRLAALLTLVQIYRHAGKDESLKQRCVEFYLSHTGYINNWDLVDLSCYEIVGRWLEDRDRELLYRLVREGSTIWEQRIGIVSTLHLIRRGELDDTYALAGLFLDKGQPLHDLLQKAAGWMLREAGKRDMDRLRGWIDVNLPRMPRTMLRYAIEKFPEGERRAFLIR